MTRPTKTSIISLLFLSLSAQLLLADRALEGPSDQPGAGEADSAVVVETGTAPTPGTNPSPETSAGEQKHNPAQADPTYPTPKPLSIDKMKEGVQVTELARMRTLAVLDEASRELEPLVKKLLLEADFRLFPIQSAPVGEAIDATYFRKIDSERKSDLIFYLKSTLDSGKEKFGFHQYEALVEVETFSPRSGEYLAQHPSRQLGERHIDSGLAERSAREAAAVSAIKEAITKTLEKAHKAIVHETIIAGVMDEAHLLAIKEYTARLEGVYHVREMLYDPERKIATLEILAAPQTERFWRAYMEKLPKREAMGGDSRFVANPALIERHTELQLEPNATE